MRDTKRIKRILSLIEELWMINPDLRFGQFVESIKPRELDFFYFEDDALEEILIDVKCKAKNRRK